MRWPFHFGRRAVGEKAPAAAPQRRDWASLPPTQRSIGELALTAATPEFVDSLAGAHDPDLSLQPLGHHVSLDAPRGLVVARSVESYTPSTPMIDRPRPRQAQLARGEVDEAAGEEAVLPVEVLEASDPLSATEPLRSLPAVEPVAASAVPLTRLSQADTALVAPFRPAKQSVSGAEVPNFALAASEVTSSFAGVPAPPAQRLTLGQSRRLGLGAPMTRSAPVVQRVVQPSAPLDLPAVPRQVPAPDVPADSVTSATSEQAEPVIQTTSGIGPLELAGLPAVRPPANRVRSSEGVQRAVDHDDVYWTPEPEIDAPSAPVPATAPEPAIQRVVARTLPPLFTTPAKPVVGTVPLAPGRSPVTTLARTETERGSQLVPVQLMPVERLPTYAAAIDAPFATPASPITSRSEITRGLPPALAVALPRRELSLPLSVAQREPTTPDASMTAIPLQASSAVGVSARWAPVQRAVEAAEGPSTPAAAEPASAPTSVSAAGPAAGAAPSPHSEQELAELARKLYEPISARLRRELLVDRERAGMLTDLR